MSFIASVDFKKRLEVNCPFDRAFDLLADVPKSVKHFPNVDQLVDLGGNAFRWKMNRIGVDRFSIQTIYGCKYVADREKGTIKWTPVKGEGNGTVKGKWTLKALDAENTRIDLTTTGELEIPLPGLVKFLVAPVVTHEFGRMVDTYVENLSKTLNAPEKKKPASKRKSA